jgi:hypothetical protein
MTDPRSLAAVMAIDRKIQQALSPFRAWRAEGRGIDAGRAIIREDGETSDNEETYAILVPAAPTPGMDSVMLNVGGNVVHLGVIVQDDSGGFDVGIGQTAMYVGVQTNADNTSTSNYTVFVDGMTLNVPLPDGVYDFTVDGSLLAAHTTNDQIDIRVEAGTTNSAIRSPFVPSGMPTARVTAMEKFTNYSVVGSVTFRVTYRCTNNIGGGTTSVANPALKIHVLRKG